MWMRKPTPVMTPSMTSVRWSTAKAKFTWNPVTASHGALLMESESGALADFMYTHRYATMIAGASVKSKAMAATAARGSLRPSVPFSRKPANGSSGMSQSRLGSNFIGSRLVLQQVDLVDVESFAHRSEERRVG